MYATRDDFSTVSNPRRLRRRSAQSQARARSVSRTTRSAQRRSAPLSPAKPSVRPSTGPSARPPASRRRAMAHQAARQQRVSDLTRETVIKLSVNVMLIGLSATALAKLVPSHLTQQTQLREIDSELTSTRKRVDELRADFTRTFDPMQAYAVMQQQSHLIDPHQRPVVFTQVGPTTDEIQP